MRQMTEERCKEQYVEEIKKVTQKHKSEISATKKKQWVSMAFVIALPLSIFTHTLLYIQRLLKDL